MAGGFVLVVGPSGAGKDTLIGLARRSLAGDPRFVFPRRLVTRAGSVHEDNERIDEATFEAGRAAGRFTLAWRAHGLGYAVPASARDSALKGHVVVCNVSRALVEEARASLPDVSVVEISACEPVLSRRLKARDRSADGDIEARLARSRSLVPPSPDLLIVNETTPEYAADELVAFLRRKAG
jgi:ribose 1,5-bisphosphokinase